MKNIDSMRPSQVLDLVACGGVGALRHLLAAAPETAAAEPADKAAFEDLMAAALANETFTDLRDERLASLLDRVTPRALAQGIEDMQLEGSAAREALEALRAERGEAVRAIRSAHEILLGAQRRAEEQLDRAEHLCGTGFYASAYPPAAIAALDEERWAEGLVERMKAKYANAPTEEDEEAAARRWRRLRERIARIAGIYTF